MESPIKESQKEDIYGSTLILNTPNSEDHLSKVSKNEMDTEQVREKAKKMILRESSEFKNSNASTHIKKAIIQYDSESEIENE